MFYLLRKRFLDRLMDGTAEHLSFRFRKLNMQSSESPLSDDVRRSLAEASVIAASVDRAVSAAVPEIVDIQVAAAPSGIVAISGVVPSVEAARRADEAARSIPGVRQLINSLTI